MENLLAEVTEIVGEREIPTFQVPEVRSDFLVDLQSAVDSLLKLDGNLRKCRTNRSHTAWLFSLTDFFGLSFLLTRLRVFI
jgi:hypothetical protein